MRSAYFTAPMPTTARELAQHLRRRARAPALRGSAPAARSSASSSSSASLIASPVARVLSGLPSLPSTDAEADVLELHRHAELAHGREQLLEVQLLPLVDDVDRALGVPAYRAGTATVAMSVVAVEECAVFLPHDERRSCFLASSGSSRRRTRRSRPGPRARCRARAALARRRAASLRTRSRRATCRTHAEPRRRSVELLAAWRRPCAATAAGSRRRRAAASRARRALRRRTPRRSSRCSLASL